VKRSILLFLALMGLLPPLLAAAATDPWYIHYQNGEQALAARDWRTAVSELGQAIERRSDSGLRLRTDGTKLVNYFPYLRLGVAYIELGDYDAALQAFDTEERLGLVVGVPEEQATLRRERQRAIESRARSVEEARALTLRRAEILSKSKSEARSLLAEGRIDDGVKALASGLAVAPDDAEALALMNQLQERARSSEEAAQSRESRSTAEPGVAPSSDAIPMNDALPNQMPPDLVRRLALAESDLAQGRSEDALAAAHRVLASDRGNAVALDIVRRAYAEISRRLLGVAPAGAVAPPVIRFANPRVDVGGELIERVVESAFELSGVAISRTPVALEAVEGTAFPRRLEIASSSQAVGDTVITEFRVPLELGVGRSTIAVVARDQAGATSRGEFVAVFERPWFRSPWATGSALVVALFAAGALTLHRWRERRRRQALGERGFNPYVAGGPVFDQTLFYGREPLVRRILQTVHSNSLMLHGERRIGKTSLLHQVRLRLAALDDPEYRFHAVYVDLQGTREHQLFATMADQIFEGLGDSVAGEREPALARETYDHHDLVRELHALLAKLQSTSARAVRLVLLIDEVDELNHYDPRVNQKLRSLFMKSFSESLVAVVAGVGIRKEWEREGSPWYNFFEEVAVEPIAVEDARELVLAPIRGVFKVEAGVADDIVARCDRKPFQIQKLCRALVNRLHETGRKTITRADVAAVAE
jgi:tetratricopeptide (TPR) repeat protein